MERQLCAWIAHCHETRQVASLTQYSIIRKARALQKELYPNDVFTGSKGWFERFGNRNPESLRLTLKHGKPRYELEKGKRGKKVQTRRRKAETFSDHLAQQEEIESECIYIEDLVKEEAANGSLVQIDSEQFEKTFGKRTCKNNQSSSSHFEHFR